MKRLFALGVMTVAVLGFSAQSAFAWWPCFPLCGCCKKSKCCTTISIKQYNAFTPVCCGSLHCDGCCPVNMSPPCCGVQSMCGPGIFGLGASCYGGGCCEGGSCCADSCGGQLPAATSLPQAQPNTAYTAPLPAQSRMPMGAPVHQTGYQPMMNPYMGMNPYAQQMNPYMGMNPYAQQMNPYMGMNPYAQQMNPYAQQMNPYYWQGK
ncbi:MAG: hypothetical protein AB7K24_08015 [Gemmataceae bacterium]